MYILNSTSIKCYLICTNSMDKYYTNEVNTQILISILKANNIRKVIASPGTTNINFVASVEHDDFFEVYSAADERSAAYIACGMAEESGEPVVISCTGATASRNYAPGLTEAFYRKLPVIAITSTQHSGKIGQNVAQVIDRSVIMNDIAKLSVNVPTVHSNDDLWSCNVQINKAILEVKRRGSGPVHINIETTYNSEFSIKDLPYTRIMKRVGYMDEFPNLAPNKIGIFVGAHSRWSDVLVAEVEKFCEKYNAVVLCDHTSNYHGNYKVLFNLITSQNQYTASCNDLNTIIHIGNVSGAYPNFNSKEEWRVNPDGEIRDTFGKLSTIFEMDELYFFKKMNEMISDNVDTNFASDWKNEYQKLRNIDMQLPFSNLWIASILAQKFEKNTILHLGILNTLRSWNYFETLNPIECYSNTGGFGIDGILSSAIGASIANPNKNIFCILGDLAFFYDLNSLGNRHVGNNLRILLINNGRGTEFRNYNHIGSKFGDEADNYIAAANHYGAKSDNLVKNYVENLGFNYISASDKEEFMAKMDLFLSNDGDPHSVVFEVFTNWYEESDALESINNLIKSNSFMMKKLAKNIIGTNNLRIMKKIIKK